MIFHGDCLEMLPYLPRVDCIFADPPDNLGLDYAGFKDRMPDYYGFLERLIRGALGKTDRFWLSYYWSHDLEIKHIIRQILRYERPSYGCKTFIWRFTFGQHNKSDCGSGYRSIARLARLGVAWNTAAIMKQSERQRMGDKRANPDGRVPDDVFEFPRVTGNSAERRDWHPTQHPESLMSRIVRLSTTEGGTFVDCFGGTGTSLRVAKALKRRCLISEISDTYVKHLAAEHKCDVVLDPRTLGTVFGQM